MPAQNLKKLDDFKLMELAALYKDCAENESDPDVAEHFKKMFAKVRIEQKRREKEKPHCNAADPKSISQIS